MPKGEGTRAWRKSGRQREGATSADPQDLDGMVKAALPASQFPVGPIMTHRQSRPTTMVPLPEAPQDGRKHLRGQDRGSCILTTERMGHLNHPQTYNRSQAWDGLPGASPM